MPKRTKKTKNRKKLHTVVKILTLQKKPSNLHETGIVAGIIALIVIALQLVYPADRTLPFTKVADIQVGSLTKREAIQYLFASYSSVELTVDVAGKPVKTTTDRAGVLVDFQKAADATARYPLWQRLIPLSLFYKAAVINAKPEITVDAQLAGQFAKEIQRQCDVPAQEASVTIEHGEVVLKKGADGRLCSDKQIQENLSSTLLRHGKATAQIIAQTTSPKKTNQIATAQFIQAKSIIDSGLTVVVAGKKMPVPRGTLASWVVFNDDVTKRIHTVDLSDAAIRSYLQSLSGDVYIAPFPTDVHTIDGRESSREAGRPGRDIDYDNTIAQIKQALLQNKTATVNAKVTDVTPPLNYLHNYSQSQRGLEKLLADIVAEKGNYAITVTELGGMGRTASVNGDRKYVNASTYKLFIAYVVLKDIESGALKWEDVITGGLNVRQCFEEMIVRSANRCALAYKARYGASAIVDRMHQLGFASVEHNSTWWTAPNDMALYMKKLERSELLQGESREFLLGLLKRQVWRYGIPTGIRGVTIADKVGFLDSYIHDLAIVYSPKRTYILTIMTKGGSYGGMADAARRINTYLNQ
jgi:beta-lactamase class A